MVGLGAGTELAVGLGRLVWIVGEPSPLKEAPFGLFAPFGVNKPLMVSDGLG